MFSLATISAFNPSTYEEACEIVKRQLLGHYPKGTFMIPAFGYKKDLSEQLAILAGRGLCVLPDTRGYSECRDFDFNRTTRNLPVAIFLCEKKHLLELTNRLAESPKTAIVSYDGRRVDSTNDELLTYTTDGDVSLLRIKYDCDGGEWKYYDGFVSGAFVLEDPHEAFETILEVLGDPLANEVCNRLAIVNVISLEENNNVFERIVKVTEEMGM